MAEKAHRPAPENKSPGLFRQSDETIATMKKDLTVSAVDQQNGCEGSSPQSGVYPLHLLRLAVIL